MYNDNNIEQLNLQGDNGDSNLSGMNVNEPNKSSKRNIIIIIILSLTLAGLGYAIFTRENDKSFNDSNSEDKDVVDDDVEEEVDYVWEASTFLDEYRASGKELTIDTNLISGQTLPLSLETISTFVGPVKAWGIGSSNLEANSLMELLDNSYLLVTGTSMGHGASISLYDYDETPTDEDYREYASNIYFDDDLVKYSNDTKLSQYIEDNNWSLHLNLPRTEYTTKDKERLFEIVDMFGDPTEIYMFQSSDVEYDSNGWIKRSEVILDNGFIINFYNMIWRGEGYTVSLMVTETAYDTVYSSNKLEWFSYYPSEDFDIWSDSTSYSKVDINR